MVSDIQSSFRTRSPKLVRMSSITCFARCRASGEKLFCTYAAPSASPSRLSVVRAQRFQRGRSCFAPVKRELNANDSFTNGLLSHGEALDSS